MSRMFRWLRENAEHHLMLAAQKDMARQYLQRGGPVAQESWFWDRVFVPVYRLMPWWLRRRIMSAMPGSHRRWKKGSRRRAPSRAS